MERCQRVEENEKKELIRRLKRRAEATAWVLVAGFTGAALLLLIFFPQRFFEIVLLIPF